MRFAMRTIIALLVLVSLLAAGLWIALPSMNDRQTDGEIVLPGLIEPVRVVRDANGTPYIYAENTDDVIRAQGFVTGQDRLFQVEAAKRAATGRLAEVFGAGNGDVILNLDKEARTIGFHRLARRQAQELSPSARQTISVFREGLNAYITKRKDTHPMEFRLAGFEPEIWTDEDVLAVMFYLGWASSANFDAELIAHEVIQNVGVDRFREIAPLAINPDSRPTDTSATARAETRWFGDAARPADWTRGGWRQQGFGGSNNWAMSGAKAGQPAAIITNDPHLDSRVLPGPWHPVGLITPDFRVVGVSTGLPGIVVGRNEHIAVGVTNAYADAVDVYIETVDPNNPDHYLEGDRSYPFETTTEMIRVKDEGEASGYLDIPLTIRFTRRGPVISDDTTANSPETVMTMRWASAEYMSSEIGLDALMRARTIEEALAAIASLKTVSLNFVVGDVTGRVARRASGAAPIRLRGDGMTPFPVVDGIDNWGGPIPGNEMPGEIDPARGWTGTANHLTAPSDYPYVYTTYASPAFRYQRMQALFSAPRVTAEDAWAAQYDTVNLFARDIAPILARALLTAEDETLQDLGETFQDWDYIDDRDSVATTLFQETVRQLAQITFEDELGPDATHAYLSSWYVWQQRFHAMLMDGNANWFDDARTQTKEDLTMMVRKAGDAALARLSQDYGSDRTLWRWGLVNQIRFVGPLRREGVVGRLMGNQDFEMAGSGETLLRALYPYHKPFDTQWMASLRMTADLNDPDKVRAVLPGGVVGRTFHANLSDQSERWLDATTETYWWFSDKAIAENTEASLTLAAQD